MVPCVDADSLATAFSEFDDKWMPMLALIGHPVNIDPAYQYEVSWEHPVLSELGS